MTYLGFLAIFLLPPIAALLLIEARRHGLRRVSSVFLLASIALIYTTPWDNYLVAQRVWWYAENQVLGITLGWVPLEEYLFFVLQPIMTGLWTLRLARQSGTGIENSRRRKAAASWALALWALSSLALLSGMDLPSYGLLILVWGLPPVALQLRFGADLLWNHRRSVLPGILVPSIYLALADALAIRSGIWSINPAETVGVQLQGILPLEELIFFVLTNVLVAFGTVLINDEAAQARLTDWRLLRRLGRYLSRRVAPR